MTSGMVVGGSLSKSAANDSAGATSQVSSVVLAALVLLTLLFLAPFFEKLPEATLAAVVIHALWHRANPRKLARVRTVNPREFLLAVVVLVTVLVLDTLPAIILGVVISLLMVVYRMSFPRTSELGRDPVTGQFQSRELHDDAEPIPGIVVYRFEAPLVYSNAAAFASRALELVEAADPPARALVVDCEVMFEIDYTGVESMEGLLADLQDRHVELRLARAHGAVLASLRTTGTLETIGEDKVFARVELAVARDA